MAEKEKAKKEVKEEKQKAEAVEEIAEKTPVEKPVEDVKEKPDEKPAEKEIPKKDVSGWTPKTEIGRKVKSGEISSLSDIKEKGIKILEPDIVEVLLPELESDLLLIGQAKGKFGGGQRRVFKQTQKKTKEGNKPSFATYAVVGNRNGFVGVGYGKSKETVPAREKALRNAKLSIMQIKRGCGSWQCCCAEPHSIPFEVEGKCGSVVIRLMPAPKGTGLCVEPELQKILKLAGITDIWSKSKGQTKTKINLVKACLDALNNLTRMKTFKDDEDKLGVIRGIAKQSGGQTGAE
jgi:small subunit ribosomal protein S5